MIEPAEHDGQQQHINNQHAEQHPACEGEKELVEPNETIHNNFDETTASQFLAGVTHISSGNGLSIGKASTKQIETYEMTYKTMIFRPTTQL